MTSNDESLRVKPSRPSAQRERIIVVGTVQKRCDKSEKCPLVSAFHSPIKRNRARFGLSTLETQHCHGCPQQNVHIQKRTFVTNIIQIILKLDLRILHARPVLIFHLSPAGDSGLYRMTYAIKRHL